jgi:hypothetical protein
VNLSENK